MKKLTLIFSLFTLYTVAQSSCPGTIINGANNNCNGNSNCSNILVLDMSLDTLLNAYGSDSSIICNTPGNSGVNCNPAEMDMMNYYLYNTDPVNNKGVSCIYNGGGEYIGVLFVALTDFFAEINTTNNTIEVNWVTAAEKDNDFFTLKKSTDGINWISVADIQGAGNSDEEMVYAYTDTDYSNETVYYQLTQTDFDGTVHEYGIITVKKAEKKTVFAKTNLLGQPVDQYYKGMVIVTYDDGTSEKIYQQ